MQGPDGTLYGTTAYGGSGSNCFGSIGCGTVFRLSPDGSGFTLLHTFTGGPTDGATPYAGLIQGPDGTLYGTTAGTIFQGSSVISRGSVFRLAPDGSGFTILHSFTGNPPDEGADPEAGVIQGSDGTLYGTTRQSYFGVGTLFKMAPDGSGFTVVHRFTGGPTGGAYPRAGLIQGSDGTLYGTTEGGGSVDNGTVFQVAPDGSGFTLLHSFTNRPTDGAAPDAGLIQGSDGTLSGTTVVGGAVGRGTVFKMAPDGSGYTLLTSFTDTPTGGNRFAALVHVR
jgi:uncharacterized repeat protein (TIGR03803 family)